MERLVSIVPAGSLILDAGTPLVAVRNMNRQYIVIEKGKEYVAVAAEHLGT